MEHGKSLREGTEGAKQQQRHKDRKESISRQQQRVTGTARVDHEQNRQPAPILRRALTGIHSADGLNW